MSMVAPPSLEEVEIEERIPLTATQRRELLEKQNYRCGCGCGAELRHEVGGQTLLAPMIDEHVIPLWKGGTNALWNRSMWAVECSAAKTRRETRERGKVNRLRRRRGAPGAPPMPTKQKIRSRGFRKDPLR